MSMQYYAFVETGLLLNGLVEDDVLEELAEADAIEFQFSFTGEAFPLDDCGLEDWGLGKPITDKTLYYLGVKHRPRLFRAAYANMDDLLSELIGSYNLARKTDKRLPRLTPKQVRRRIMAIQGTYYG